MPLDPEKLDAFDDLATEFAALAGAEIMAARNRTLEISYKIIDGSATASDGWTDPVTNVDRSVERHIRDSLHNRFPDHTVIGEEMGADWQRSDFAWAIDPIDGTTNFLNGFPLFSASIGLLWKGRPIAGAIWCTASHALHCGTYHARAEGDLRFDGVPVVRPDQPGIRRRLIGLPPSAHDKDNNIRTTGSAALECAFVAAGLLAGTRFLSVNLWDVAAGIVLVQAAGGVVLERQGSDWAQFDSFCGWMSGDGGLAKNDLVLAEDLSTAEKLAA